MRAIFSYPIEVRFRDCDPMGHANNAVYLTYLEQARLAHWRSLGGFDASTRGAGATPAASGVPGVILARVEVDYKRPARYGEVLEVRIGIAAMGRTSFTYEYEIVDEARALVAAARTVLVMYDYASARPVPVPDDIRRRFDTL